MARKQKTEEYVEPVLEWWGSTVKGMDSFIIEWDTKRLAYVLCDDNVEELEEAKRFRARQLSKAPSYCVLEQDGDTEITLVFPKEKKEEVFQALKWG